MAFCPNCGKEIDPMQENCPYCGQSLKTTTLNKCDFCATPVVYSEYFHCKYCGGKFCYDHRLPENHLCKSTNMRRVIPGTSSSSAGSYSYSSPPRYSQPTRAVASKFGFNISKPGRNLVIVLIAGLLIGSALSYIAIGGFPLSLYLLQWNALVYQGAVWELVTSLFFTTVAFGFTFWGVLDVAFNSIALIWLDRMFASIYTPRQYYLTFIATGIFGNVISLFYGPLVISSGASGGIFGLIAGVVTADYAINRRLNPSLLMWFLFIFILSSLGGPVDTFAHFGGALLGLPLGYYIGRNRRAMR